MNILFTFPFMFHPERGGTERVTDILATELKRRGHNIFYMNMVHNPNYESYNYPGEITFIEEHSSDLEKRQLEYQAYLQAHKIDVVVNQGGIMGSCRFFCETGSSGVKSITVVHTDPMMNYNVLFNEICLLRENSVSEHCKRIARIVLYPYRKYKLHKYLTNHFDQLCLVTNKLGLLSNELIPNLKKLSPSFPEENIFAIGNPCTYAVKRNLEKKRRIIFVGRMDLGPKRPDRMIKIWKKISPEIPDWELIMIGDGAGRKRLETLAKGIDNISFTGFVDPEPYYRDASILCMTSNYEGWGMVLTEAMSYGVVPIAFKSYASVTDIITDDNQLVNPFSINEYVRKLKKIIDDSALRERLKERGFVTAEKYSVGNVVDQWEALLKKL